MVNIWAFQKRTGVIRQINIDDAVDKLEAELPADQYPTRMFIVRGLCNGGMLETKDVAYSTLTANFAPFIKEAA